MPQPGCSWWFSFFSGTFIVSPAQEQKCFEVEKNGHIHANLRDDANSGKGLDT